MEYTFGVFDFLGFCAVLWLIVYSAVKVATRASNSSDDKEDQE